VSITLAFYPGVVHSTVAPIADGVSPVSTVAVSQWNVSDRISSDKASTWNIPAYGISKQAQITFETEGRIHVTGWLVTHGICTPVVWPIDERNFVPAIAFDVDARTLAQKRISFNVIQRISPKHAAWFDVYNYLFSHSQVRFDTLQRVFKPGVTVGSWTNQLDEPVVKALSSGNFTVSPVIQWNEQKELSVTKTIRFNDTFRLSSDLQVVFNDYSIVVVCREEILWNTLERI
jgi:hypothetical protein